MVLLCAPENLLSPNTSLKVWPHFCLARVYLVMHNGGHCFPRSPDGNNEAAGAEGFVFFVLDIRPTTYLLSKNIKWTKLVSKCNLMQHPTVSQFAERDQHVTHPVSNDTFWVPCSQQSDSASLATSTYKSYVCNDPCCFEVALHSCSSSEPSERDQLSGVLLRKS